MTRRPLFSKVMHVVRVAEIVKHGSDDSIAAVVGLMLECVNKDSDDCIVAVVMVLVSVVQCTFRYIVANGKCSSPTSLRWGRIQMSRVKYGSCYFSSHATSK